MKPPALIVIELPVVCTVAPCRRLNPFHRALLRVLEVFPPGARPGFGELAGRMMILEPVFLLQAWSELVAWRATDADDFAVAAWSVAGEEAARSGWCVVGERETRRTTVYLRREDGGPMSADTFEFTEERPLRTRPEWCGRGMASRIAASIKLAPGERVVSFAADWDAAREGRADNR
ncbi:MAG: hypothetical protein H7067_17135 [Burkholderiales bacterium]|nr:hypothetical protein [Opitutaceae bacterium]